MITFAGSDDIAARADWARLLEEHPAGRVHADLRWLDVLRQAYGVEGTLVIERDAGGEVRAGLAGYQSFTLRGRPTFHSLRHGVLTRSGASPSALLAAAGESCRSRGCIEALVGGAPFPLDGPYRPRTRFSVSLDLTPGPQPLWDGFRDKVRNTIRKAERGGLTVSRDATHLDAFHAIHARTMTEKRGTVRPLLFFHTLFATFGGDVRLYSALDGGRVCGAMVVVVVGRHAAYPFGAFDERGRELGANSLLLWQVARELSGEGVCSLDLGPSAQGSGVYRFKVHMGGVPETLHYVDLLQAARAAEAPGTSPPAAATSRPLAILDRAIERLPLSLRIRARMWLGRKGRLL